MILITCINIFVDECADNEKYCKRYKKCIMKKIDVLGPICPKLCGLCWIWRNKWPCLSKTLLKTFVVVCQKIILIFLFSDGQKSCTFFLEFFCGPPGGGGPILELVDFVKWSSPTAWFFPKTTYLFGKNQAIGGLHFPKSTSSKIGPTTPGGPRKNSRKNLQDFCPSL